MSPGRLSCLLACLLITAAASAGPLNPPPGPIEGTMRTLEEIEPRIPIDRMPASATAKHVITQPGSYYLTSNLIGEPGKHGIEVEADHVTIDLRGFSMVGPGGASDNDAIKVGPGPRRTGIHILNGTIANWEDGIDLSNSTGVTCDSILSVFNAGKGFWLGFQAIVTNCIAQNNGGNGFEADIGAVLDNCVSRANWSGIYVFQVATITNCAAWDNAFIGIEAGYYSVITHCTATNNGEAGIVSDAGTQISGCTAQWNTFGIWVRDQSTVRECTVSNNVFGIAVRCCGTGCRIESNTVNGPGLYGITVDDDPAANQHLIIRNSVHGVSTSYFIPARSSFGPIVDVSGGGDISAVTGSDHPLANFVH